jgi:6-phosphogluconolactonase
VVAFTYDAPHGTLQPLHTVSTLPEGCTDGNLTAHVLVAPSGRFLYGSNRGHDSIAIFAVQPESGRLTPLGHAPSGGTWTWPFAIDPAGTCMVVANYNNGGMATYRLDPERGTRQHAHRRDHQGRGWRAQAALGRDVLYQGRRSRRRRRGE